jgi:hypothetical protein
MKTSETIDELAKALVKAQSQMGGAVADSNNPFFKSKYADLGSVVKAIKEPFCDNGLSYVQFPCTSERGVGVTTRLIHVSGQWLEQEYTLPLTKQDPQAAGSAITYARRYALQAIAGIPTADDDGEAAMQRNVVHQKPQQSKPKSVPAQKAPTKTPKVAETAAEDKESTLAVNNVETEEQAIEVVEVMLGVAGSMHTESSATLKKFYKDNVKVITEIQKFPKADKVLRDGFTKLNEKIQEKDNA